jgi:hypothetical protein
MDVADTPDAAARIGDAGRPAGIIEEFVSLWKVSDRDFPAGTRGVK